MWLWVLHTYYCGTAFYGGYNKKLCGCGYCTLIIVVQLFMVGTIKSSVAVGGYCTPIIVVQLFMVGTIKSSAAVGTAHCRNGIN